MTERLTPEAAETIKLPFGPISRTREIARQIAELGVSDMYEGEWAQSILTRVDLVQAATIRQQREELTGTI